MVSKRILVAVVAAPLCVLGAGAMLPQASVARAESNVEPTADPNCVLWWPEARYRNFGYDHIVHLYNRCKEPAECTVSTDTNPTPVVVTVESDEHMELLMFRGSPAREFVPTVDCR
jgi:hypothetical protein